jgi:FtsZ-binding cell division protein ZapB
MIDARVTEAVRDGLRTGRLPRGLQELAAPDIARDARLLRVERDDLASRVETLDRETTNLRRELDHARREAQRLRRELDGRQVKADHDGLYRRVGLDPDAPDFLLIAARKAHRFDAHPDRATPRLKEEAHRRFVRAEEIFAQIWQMRGMKG